MSFFGFFLFFVGLGGVLGWAGRLCFSLGFFMCLLGFVVVGLFVVLGCVLVGCLCGRSCLCCVGFGWLFVVL